jgi:catechol 2,3-dioxygenase-like lactoylglutathione lyase family enzyme
MNISEAYVTYNASDFDVTCAFYEQRLGFRPVHRWDRADGRGCYYAAGEATVVEILGAARGDPPLTPPPSGSGRRRR